MRASLFLVVAAAVLPLVSSCAKPPEKIKVNLQPMTKGEAGFQIDMPEPHVERDIPCGRCYYYNAPQGTYKVVVNMYTLSMSNRSTPQAKMNRDRIAIQSLAAHAGTYVDALASKESKSITLNYKHQGFEDKGNTNVVPSPDGHRRLFTKWAENEVVLNDGNPVGEYIIRGYVGENAIYTTSVEGKPEFVNTPDAQQFLDSFKITGESALPPGKAAP
jgi:hypothetical protein